MIHVLNVIAHAPPPVWVLTLLAFAVWRIDVELRPFAPCRVCGGSGRSRGSRPGAFGLCPHVRKPRLLARKAAQRHEARIARRKR